MDWTLLLPLLLIAITADLWFGFLLHRLVSYFWYKYAYPESETKANRLHNDRRRRLIASVFWFWIAALVVSLTVRTVCGVDHQKVGLVEKTIQTIDESIKTRLGDDSRIWKVRNAVDQAVGQ